MRTLYWKLFQKYFIIDQTNRNCILNMTSPEVALVLAVMKIQEKRLLENFTPIGMKSLKPLILFLLCFSPMHKAMASQLLCVNINVMLLLSGFWISHSALQHSINFWIHGTRSRMIHLSTKWKPANLICASSLSESPWGCRRPGWRDTPGPLSHPSLLRDGYNLLCP